MLTNIFMSQSGLLNSILDASSFGFGVCNFLIDNPASSMGYSLLSGGAGALRSINVFHHFPNPIDDDLIPDIDGNQVTTTIKRIIREAGRFRFFEYYDNVRPPEYLQEHSLSNHK